MSTSWQQFLSAVLSFLEEMRLPIGDTEFSILAIAQLALYLLLVFLLVRLLKNVIQQRLLVRLGIDRGNRAAIATIVSYTLGILVYIVILQSTGINKLCQWHHPISRTQHQGGRFCCLGRFRRIRQRGDDSLYHDSHQRRCSYCGSQ